MLRLRRLHLQLSPWFSPMRIITHLVLRDPLFKKTTNSQQLGYNWLNCEQYRRFVVSCFSLFFPILIIKLTLKLTYIAAKTGFLIRGLNIDPCWFERHF